MLASHLILAKDVRTFLADSYLPDVVNHDTFKSNWQSIMENNFDFLNSNEFGVVNGVYCSSGKRGWQTKTPKQGWDWRIPVAINCRKPFECANPTDVKGRLFDAHGGTLGAADVTKILLSEGYDAVICEDGVVIALSLESTRIVVDEAGPIGARR